MLAHAARGYVHRHGVLAGERVIVATNNDDAYLTAAAMAQAGSKIVAILDSRPAALETPFPTYALARPIGTRGARHHLTSVTAEIGDTSKTFDADLLVMSGGFTPVVHLHSHAGGLLDWREDVQAFVPGIGPTWVSSVGTAAGEVHPIANAPANLSNPKRSFIDFQNDVTASDIDLAWREGYRSVEHLKRYTTLGMATDQGKTSNMAALSRLAQAGDVTIPSAGLTTFRPPYTPVTLGVLGGADAGGHAAPTRRLALLERHLNLAPIWQPLGYWHRPRAYPRANEDLHAAASRESRTVRTSVGMIDVSTLAKFAIKGPDAAALLEIACATKVATLAVGRGRYTFMCREDGMIFDDGTVWRLDEGEWLLTSSTGGADRMEAHLSYIRHVLAPGLRVSIVPQQENMAAIAVAGPQATTIMEKLVGVQPPRHMHALRSRLADIPVLILAASYSGERGFETYVRGHDAGQVWDVIAAEVVQAGGCPYGLEALEYLRIEKGHIGIGTEVDGRTTPGDLGLGRMARAAGGFVGAHGLTRPYLSTSDRQQLVGLISKDSIPEGAMLIPAPGEPVQGHVTSASPRVLESGGVALALLNNGRARVGTTLLASSPTRQRDVSVTVTEPLFYDLEGTRYRD
jgi:sarcosine oxidase subunit alpha